MTTARVSFNVGDGIWSANLIWSNTGEHEQEAIRDTARRHADKYGYPEFIMTVLSEAEAEADLRKGMPMYHIDEQAEQDYDPSFR